MADNRPPVWEHVASLQAAAWAKSGRRMPTKADYLDTRLEVIGKAMFAQGAQASGLEPGTPKYLDAERESLDRARQHFAVLEAPTEFQDPILYDVLVRLFDRIASAAQTVLSLAPTTRPVFASLPSGRVNAMAMRFSDTGDQAILFEAGLFTFANLAAKVVAQSLPMQKMGKQVAFSWDLDKVRAQLDRSPDITRHWLDALLSYVSKGNPGRAEAYVLQEPYVQTLTHHLFDGFELFVMGHEYGHIVAGHLSGGQVVASALGQEVADEILFRWEQEVEADQIGTALSLRAMNESHKLDAALSFMGTALFFCCADVITKCVTVLSTGAEPETIDEASSHPPPMMRLEVMLKALSSMLPEEQSRSAAELAHKLKGVVDELWSRSVPALKREHAAGLRPSAEWL
jgi:hypothetical protein